MNRFLISVAESDNNNLYTLLIGLEAHADMDAIEVKLTDLDVPAFLFKMLPYLKGKAEAWIVTFYSHEAIEVALKLAESVDWAQPSQVLFASDDARSHWTLEHFHKRVMVEGAYRVKVA